MRKVALILINTRMEKKHFALGWTLIAFLVQLSIIKTEVESYGNTIKKSKQNACPRSSCDLSRDGRQAAELLSNVLSAGKTGNGFCLFNRFIYLFIESTEDDTS